MTWLVFFCVLDPTVIELAAYPSEKTCQAHYETADAALRKLCEMEAIAGGTFAWNNRDLRARLRWEKQLWWAAWWVTWGSPHCPMETRLEWMGVTRRLLRDGP